MGETASKERRTIWHGSYGEWTHYDIVQHHYACSDCEDERQGYIEVLEIKDAPPAHNKFVIHDFGNDTGSTVYDFTSLEDAKNALELVNRNERHQPKNIAGCVRVTRFGATRPWFYLEP